MTRIEHTLLAVAAICAVLLLFAPVSGRTRWVHDKGTTMTHSAGWDWVAPLAGIVASLSLVAGRLIRPGVFGAVLAAAIAAAAFALTAAAAGGHWVDLMVGSLEIERWTLYPSSGVSFHAVTAIVGLACTLVLLGSWLRPGDSEW